MSTQDQSVDSQLPTATGTWTVDLTRTTASFTVTELGGLITVRGTVPVTSAALGFDATGLLSWVTAELDPTGVLTGNPKRDKDLQGRSSSPPSSTRPGCSVVGGPTRSKVAGR